MSNAISSTIFAQRMALRQRLLDQSREDKMVEDDRKVKLIAELNRSTDFALQAQGKAMERKRADAAAMAENAAYLGEDAPTFDMESGSVRDAAARGASEGASATEKQVREKSAQWILERMKQEEANQRTAHVEKGRQDRFMVEAPLRGARQAAAESTAKIGGEHLAPVSYVGRPGSPYQGKQMSGVRAGIVSEMELRANLPTAYGPGATEQNDYTTAHATIMKYYDDAIATMKAKSGEMGGMGVFTNEVEIKKLGIAKTIALQASLNLAKKKLSLNPASSVYKSEVEAMENELRALQGGDFASVRNDLGTEQTSSEDPGMSEPEGPDASGLDPATQSVLERMKP